MTDGAFDRLSQVSQRTASDVERLAATLAALQGRLASLEGRVEAAGSAQVSTADRVETVASALGRLDRLEKGVAELRVELVGAASEAGRRIEVALSEARESRNREISKIMQAFDDISGRMRALESSAARDDAPARIQEVARDVTRLGQKIEALESRAAQIEHAPPRTDPAVTARLESFSEALVELRRSFDAWQRRIEEQSEIVRQARAVADSMRENVDRIERAHHATAEAQRLAEGRAEGALEAFRSEDAERWERFETARGHDWDALRKRNTDRDSQARELLAMTEDLEVRLRALDTDLQRGLAEGEAERLTERRRIVEALRALSEATAEMVATAEDGLPESERSDVSKERKAARRRAFRAQRAAEAD